MAAEPVRVEVEDGIAVLHLERPDSNNSFDRTTIKRLHEALQAAVDDDSVEAIVLTGSGRSYCTGADIQEMESHKESPKRLLDELTHFAHALVEEIQHAQKPVVAAVNGVSAGGGVGLALCADFVVMAQSARFVLAFANLGVTPDCSAVAHLTQALGVHRAREAILLDGVISSEQALAWGLANRVVAGEAVLDEARSMAKQAAARPPGVVGAAKRLVRLAMHSSLETVLEAERRSIMGLSLEPAFRQAVEDFTAKRSLKAAP